MARPLRVLLTGAPGSLEGLKPLLERAGYQVLESPLFSFREPTSWAPLDAALAQLRRYAAIAITSPRAAAAVVGRMEHLGIRPPPDLTVWCGRASLTALREAFPRVRTPEMQFAVPGRLASNLASTMLEANIGGRVLFPCGEAYREELVVRLRAAGRRVDPVVVYRAVLAAEATIARILEGADIVVVTSPRVADLLARDAPARPRPALVTIGATTAEAAARRGWPPTGVAQEPSAVGVFSLFSDPGIGYRAAELPPV